MSLQALCVTFSSGLRTTSLPLPYLSYLNPPFPYQTQIHRTAPFLSPYPLSPLSLIVPCVIQWLTPYRFILVAALIL